MGKKHIQGSSMVSGADGERGRTNCLTSKYKCGNEIKKERFISHTFLLRKGVGNIVLDEINQKYIGYEQSLLFIRMGRVLVNNNRVKSSGF